MFDCFAEGFGSLVIWRHGFLLFCIAFNDVRVEVWGIFTFRVSVAENVGVRFKYSGRRCLYLASLPGCPADLIKNV